MYNVGFFPTHKTLIESEQKKYPTFGHREDKIPLLYFKNSCHLVLNAAKTPIT